MARTPAPDARDGDLELDLESYLRRLTAALNEGTGEDPTLGGFLRGVRVRVTDRPASEAEWRPPATAAEEAWELTDAEGRVLARLEPPRGVRDAWRFEVADAVEGRGRQYAPPDAFFRIYKV